MEEPRNCFEADLANIPLFCVIGRQVASWYYALAESLKRKTAEFQREINISSNTVIYFCAFRGIEKQRRHAHSMLHRNPWKERLQGRRQRPAPNERPNHR